MATGITGFMFNVIVLSNVNMYFRKSIFEENFSINVFASVCLWHFRQLKRDCWTLRKLFFENNYWIISFVGLFLCL